ncbi:hypothetical protein A9Q83_15850 [Alphaproteobacteria bacterium 46_93_T64]|nr:hypothetical protein A9Q83_15850 [Alphaproteobacteria bacterium 46_93_T64]
MKLRLIFSVLMSFVLSFFMTLWVTWLNLGPDPLFLAKWLHAFQLAWPIAALISFISAPTIQVFAQKINVRFE